MGVLIVRDEWIQDFELMGNDLLIYARLYSFTQNVGCYAGSMEWLAQSVGATRKTAERTIKNLIARNLVKKEGKNIKCFVYDAELELDPENDPKMGQNDPKMGQNDPPMGQNDPQIINIKENKKIKGGGGCAHTHACTHEGEGSASTTPPPPPFFVFHFQSKIKTEQDRADAVRLSELMNEEQAKIFHSWVMAHKAEYHIGFYLQHWSEFLDKAIEWSAKNEQAQYKPTKPNRTIQAPPPVRIASADTPTATDANTTGYPQWRAMVADVVAVHPNTSHKDYFYRMRLTNHVAESLPQTATKEQITEFITANTLQN